MKHYLRSLLLVLTAALLVAAPPALAQQSDDGKTYKVDTLVYNGPSDQVIDVLILGDGYTADQLQTFAADAKNLAEKLQQLDPINHYAKFFNFYCIETPSNQSGASRVGSTVDNFYGSAYGALGLDRLLTPNLDKTLGMADRYVPQHDQVIMLVNDNQYGGSGGPVCTLSKNYYSILILFHEFGHTFGSLGDEYSYQGSVPYETVPNLTKESDPTKIKWKNWIGINGVGVYNWGTYGGNTWYKPTPGNCRMEYLDKDYFCAVCREGMVEKVHENVRFLSSYTPYLDAVNFTDSQEFTISVPRTPSPNTLRVTWTLDGQPLTRDVTAYTLSADKLTDGTHTLIATVEDTTDLVRVDNHTQLHGQRAQWTLTKRGGTVFYAPDHVTTYRKATEVKEGVRYVMAATDASGKHLIAQPDPEIYVNYAVLKPKEVISEDGGATLKVLGEDDNDFTFTPSAGQYLMRQHGDGRYVYSGHVRDYELSFTQDINSLGTYDVKGFSITRQDDGSFDLHAQGSYVNRSVYYNATQGGFGTDSRNDAVRPTLYEHITTIPAIGTHEGYATYYGADPFIMPDGLEGTTIALDESGEGLKMAWEYPAGKIVPARTPLLLKGTPGMSYTSLVVDNKDDAPTDNLLYGTLTDKQPTEDGKYYLLTYSDENGRQVLGFFWSKPDGAPFINRGGKAYLRLPLSVSAAALKGFSLDGPVTGLTDATTSTRTDAPVYDLSGRRVSTTGTLPAGIYIIGGKKVVK